MFLTIIGAGYVGLVTGAVFADFGNQVICLDTNAEKIANLNNDQIPFYEPGLKELVRENRLQKRLVFTTDYPQAIKDAQIIFICVGTPSQDNGETDLTYLLQAVDQTVKNVSKQAILIIKSTSPVGVDKKIEDIIDSRLGKQIDLAFCPEFLREGSAVNDCINPDRIVIGSQSTNTTQTLLKLFEPFECKKIVTDPVSAQLIKYAANCFLATKISFANMIANFAEKTGGDAVSVLEAVGLDKRIGSAFLKPGVGYGGSCFPKDVDAFVYMGQQCKVDVNLLLAIKKINSDQVDHFILKVEKEIGDLKDKKIAILGLSFKPETDDIRQAPSLAIINKLLEKGAQITAFDPTAIGNVKKVFHDQINYASDPYQTTANADALLIVTEWNEFKELDLGRIKAVMKNPVIIDGRNIYDPRTVEQLGFRYQGIGRRLLS